jgi:hypothetical protein
MVVRPVLPPVLVVMHMGIPAMGMVVQVFMDMLMGVGMRMLVGVHLVPVSVLMGTGVCMLMGMQVLVFVFPFHFLRSFRLPSCYPESCPMLLDEACHYIPV